MKKMKILLHLYIFVIFTVFVKYSSAIDTNYDSSMPDTIELSESALAPFFSFDGGYLYTTSYNQDISTVCVAEGNKTIRLMLPMTINDIKKFHHSIFIPKSEQNSNEYYAQMEMVEGCYISSKDKEDYPCVSLFQSNPTECFNNIRDSTEYWAYHRSAPMSSAFSISLAGGADVFVENILQIYKQRETLRRSIKKTKEANKAAKDLWNIVSRGWNSNNNTEDFNAFLNTMSIRGREIVRGAYADVMDKWNIIKRWMKPSVGEINDNVHTFTTLNGTLLSSNTYCNPSIYLNDWLNYFDQTFFGYYVVSGVQRDIEAFFSGHKIFYNNSGFAVNRLNHLPCITASFAIVMMLFEDFPIRLTYSDMINNTNANNTLWPRERFERLGDPNGNVTRNRNYLLNYYRVVLNYITQDPHVNLIFDGDVSLAACVRQAILRSSGTDGTPPPSSIYECISLKYGALQNKNNYNNNINHNNNNINNDNDNNIIGLNNDDEDITFKPCPWGYTRPSGNVWNNLEECVMCPQGAFTDEIQNCRCSDNSYPGLYGCLLRENENVSSPSFHWFINPSQVLISSGDMNASTQVLMISSPTNIKEGDKVGLKITCTAGLSRFEVLMPAVGENINSAKPMKLPLQSSTIIILSNTNIILRLISSAAFGGEQCEFVTWTKSLRSYDSPEIRLGTVMIVPSVSPIQISYSSNNNISPTSSLNTTMIELPLCNNLPITISGNILVFLCSTYVKKELSILVDAGMYVPITFETFRNIKQAVWADGETRAKSIGNLMKLMLNRLYITISISTSNYINTSPMRKIFDETFSLSNKNPSKLFVFPDYPARISVEIQIIDYCSTKESVSNPICYNAKIIFSPTSVSSTMFTITDNNNNNNNSSTEKSEDSRELNNEDNNNNNNNNNTLPWWLIPIIILGIMDFILIVTIITILTLFYERICKTSQIHSNINSTNEYPLSEDPQELNETNNENEGREEEEEEEEEKENPNSTSPPSLFDKSQYSNVPY